MLAGLLEGLRGLVLKRDVPQKERRATPRLRCYYPVSCVLGNNGPMHGARVTEMSRTGMRLEMADSFPRHARVRVTYAGLHPHPTIHCEVSWIKERAPGSFRMGVRYLEEGKALEATWVGHVLNSLGFLEQSLYEKRRHVRFPADLVAELQTPRGDLMSTCIVQNLGVGGALLEMPARLEPQAALLSLSPLPVSHNLARLDLLGQILKVRPNPDRAGSFLANLAFEELNKIQTKRLGAYLLNLMRGASS